MARQLPVTILAGFLGSGKTTLLNRILTADHGLRMGVILNELGEVSIDGELVTVPDDGLLELNNGCLCCTMRDDFEKAAQQLLNRMEDLDYLLIETTGVADPRQLTEIFVQATFQEQLRLDSVVTLIDSGEYWQNLHRSDNASYQIACADRILLNKIDLIDPVEQDRIIYDLRRLNPDAVCIPTTYAQIPLSQILDVHAFRPELWQPQVAEDIHPHKHPHLQHDHISSASFIFDQPLHLGRLRDWLDTLPHTVFRAKGLVWIHEEDQRVIFHHVGSRQSLYLDRLWQRDEPRYSKIVVIGKDLQRSTLSADLAQTLISAAELIYST